MGFSRGRLCLLYFLLKNGFSKKTLGRASLEEPETEPKRSLAKQALGLHVNDRRWRRCFGGLFFLLYVLFVCYCCPVQILQQLFVSAYVGGK
jgi:hypothetical protein